MSEEVNRQQRSPRNTISNQGAGQVSQVATYSEFLEVDFLPDVDVVIDVGVAGGTPWLYQRWQDAELHLVDPMPVGPGVEKSLRGRRHEVHEVALGEKPGMVKFHVNLERPSLSSVFERTPMTATDHRYSTVEIPMTALDCMLPKLLGESESKTLGLKIDAEGSELDILRGARQALRHCVFVICEASVRERFYDSYTFEDLSDYMAEQAFTVQSILSAPTDHQGTCRYINVAFTRAQASP